MGELRLVSFEESISSCEGNENEFAIHVYISFTVIVFTSCLRNSISMLLAKVACVEGSS